MPRCASNPVSPARYGSALGPRILDTTQDHRYLRYHRLVFFIVVWFRVRCSTDPYFERGHTCESHPEISVSCWHTLVFTPGNARGLGSHNRFDLWSGH